KDGIQPSFFYSLLDSTSVITIGRFLSGYNPKLWKSAFYWGWDLTGIRMFLDVPRLSVGKYRRLYYETRINV
ncbi:MAG: hypothetical protein JW715_06325, partial [Sedimentisphaerales bacterium]|nr:hypothetical protein [Sedimentisphaerales bacterium]